MEQLFCRQAHRLQENSQENAQDTDLKQNAYFSLKYFTVYLKFADSRLQKLHFTTIISRLILRQTFAIRSYLAHIKMTKI